MKAIYDSIKDVDSAELRISPDQTMYIINLDKDELPKVLNATSDGADTLFESSVSCVGAKVCQIGIRDSHGLLMDLIHMERKNHFPDMTLPRVNISGCISSCGAHQVGTMAFRGSQKSIGGKKTEGFLVYADGSHIQGEERFGKELGFMATGDIVLYMEEIGKAVADSGKDFSAWFYEDKESFRAISDKYLTADE